MGVLRSRVVVLYARESPDFGHEKPEGEWPELFVGVRRLMRGRGRLVEEGGPYAEVVVDGMDRMALYERVDEPGSSDATLGE